MPHQHMNSDNTSYGLLMYRTVRGFLQVFLARNGGPFFAKKDAGAWGIPKGGAHKYEKNPLQTAIREFIEETGLIPNGPYIPLGPITYKTGKTVYAWAFEYHEATEPHIVSNTFQLEWPRPSKASRDGGPRPSKASGNGKPPKSGNMRTYPEIDKAQFFTIQQAHEKMLEAQKPFVQRLEEHLRSNMK